MWKNQIKILKEALMKAKKENDQLKVIGKLRMIETKESVDTSLYQNILPVEAELNIQSLRRKVADLKEKLNDLMAENGRLKNQNKKLITELNKYKSIIKELYKHYTKPIHIEFSTNVNVETKMQKLRTKEDTIQEKLKESANKIRTASSLKQIIEILYSEFHSLLKPMKLGIFIIERNLKSLYQKEQGIVYPFSFTKTTIDLAISHFNEGIFPTFEVLPTGKQYKKENNILLIPIGNKITYFVIQAEFKGKQVVTKEKIEDLWIATYNNIAVKVTERLLREFAIIAVREFQRDFVCFCIYCCSY